MQYSLREFDEKQWYMKVTFEDAAEGSAAHDPAFTAGSGRTAEVQTMLAKSTTVRDNAITRAMTAF